MSNKVYISEDKSRFNEIVYSTRYTEDTKFVFAVYQAMLDGEFKFAVSLEEAAKLNFVKNALPYWISHDEIPPKFEDIDEWMVVYYLLKARPIKRVEPELIMDYGIYSFKEKLIDLLRHILKNYIDDDVRKIIEKKCKHITKLEKA